MVVKVWVRVYILDINVVDFDDLGVVLDFGNFFGGVFCFFNVVVDDVGVGFEMNYGVGLCVVDGVCIICDE